MSRAERGGGVLFPVSDFDYEASSGNTNQLSSTTKDFSHLFLIKVISKNNSVGKDFLLDTIL